MKYATGGKVLGSVVGFATLDALSAADRGPAEAFVAAVRGGTLGKVLKGTEPLTRPAGAATIATFAGGQSAIGGASPEDAVLSAATMGILRGAGGGGRITTRQAVRNVFDQFDRPKPTSSSAAAVKATEMPPEPAPRQQPTERPPESEWEATERLKEAAGVDAEPEQKGRRAGPAPAKIGTSALVEVQKVEKVTSRRQRVWDTIEEKWLKWYEPLGNLPSRKRYLEMRYLTLGKMTNIDDIGKQIFKTFRKASDTDSTAIYEYLTTKKADLNTITDKSLRVEALRVKRMIDDVGGKLVKLGLLDAEAREAHRGEYLPRIYLKYLLPEGLQTGGRPKTSDLGYLKKRKDIPKEVRDLILGEITDPAFLAAKGYTQQSRDIAVLDFLGEISREKEWVFPDTLVPFEGRKVTAQYLIAEASRIRQTVQHYKPELRKPALAKAQEMEDAAHPVIERAPAEPKKFRQIPDTKRYGMLRGMWIRKEIYDDVVGATQFVTGEQSVAAQLLDHGGVATKVTQLWKLSKVALNPPTQVRNFVSNAILLDLSGVPFYKLPYRYMEAINDIARDGKYWKIAKKYGVSKTTFASNEMYRMREDLLKLEKGIHPIRWMRNAGIIVANRASDVYGFTEALGKTVKIIDEMKKGASGADAAMEAHKALFDYSLVPPSVQYLRNAPIGVPFLTFYYKTLPRMLETAIVRPTKFLKYLLIGPALAAMIADEYDVETEDVEALREALPTWLRERGHAYILPYKDEVGRWQALDIGYFFPWAFYGELGSQLARGNLSRALQASGAAGSPLAQIIAASLNNKDPFTERVIANPADPPAKQIADIMNYIWRMAAPTWLTDIGAANRLRQALSGDVDRHGEPRTTIPQALGRFVGVNVYPIDPNRSRSANMRRMKRGIDDTNRQRRYTLKDRNLSKEERRSINKQYNYHITQQQKEMIDYMRRSQVHPNLSNWGPP